jgi:peptide/nickel transport system substrate-binding protein
VQEIVHDDHPFITVAYYRLAIAMKDSVRGYIFDPTAHDYKINPEMYIEK